MTMRKFYSVPIVLGILFLCFFIGAASADYEGETPYTVIDGDVNYTVVKFLSSGTFNISALEVDACEVLVVGGGGSSSSGWTNNDQSAGAGGAGGIVWMYGDNSYEFNATELSNGYISITVGAGGAAKADTTQGEAGNNGANSIFGRLIALGGGGGGACCSASVAGASGGCGGGGGTHQSNYLGAGGSSLQSSSEGESGTYGWGTSGQTASSATVPGAGGGASAQGGTFDRTGKTIWDANYSAGGLKAGDGGGAGAANTGNGGSAGATNSKVSYAGGSGIVVIRYLTEPPISYFKPTISYPENDSNVTDSLFVTVTWDDNASYTYQAQVSFGDPDFAEINLFYNVSDIETGEYEFELYDTTYYAARVRAFHIADEEFGPWSDVVEFYVVYTPSNIPEFTNPSNMAELSTMKVTFTYTEKETATSYEIAFCDTPDGCVEPWIITGLSPTGSLVSYLANSEFWEAEIRAKYPGEDNYSDWGNSIQFSKTNIPELVSPADSSLEQVDVNILFEWSKVNEVTGYDIQAIKSVLEPESWAAPDEEWSSSYNYSEKELSNGVWWWRVRAKDAYVNGTWSDPFFFEIDIDEIPFLYSVNSANFYGGDTVFYEFSGLLTDYYIDIYKVSQAGIRGDVITSKFIERDEANESSFEWVVPADADYSFDTVVRSTGGRLFRHYAMPYPKKLTIWKEGVHRARIMGGDYSGNAITICIGDMVYTDRDNLLHDPFDYQRALYARGEDIALHYSIDDPENTEFEIVIRNMATGATVATLNSSDIYKWNYELGYANRNFIIISTDGSVPPTVDPYLASVFAFSGDNWNTLDIPKGAYDYIIRDTVDGNINSIGESVLLIGDSTVSEWSVTPSKSSLKEGAQQVWTIAIPTDEIWDAYNQMMFIDYSSGAAVYKLTGAYDGFAEYPPIWQASFTITYNVDWDESTAPVGRLVVRPNNLNFQDFEDPETYYPFIVDKSFTITPLPDTAGDIDGILDGFGLNSELYKIIFSMAAIIAGIVIVGVMGLPVMVIGLVALMLYVVFLALGWIPMWTAILMAMAFVAVLYKMFFGGNGGEA